MDDEFETTIEKIKVLEQSKEIKLKEKRALEATLASLQRNLQETVNVTKKFQEEIIEATARADATEVELITAQTLRASLFMQLEASNRQLQQLKMEAENGFSKVWKLRDRLCSEVHKVSDQCDVWALFSKPKYIEPPNKPKKIPTDAHQDIEHAGLLETAQKRKQRLIEERERLLNEPDFGDEFKRIKNALQYSAEMAAAKTNENK